MRRRTALEHAAGRGGPLGQRMLRRRRVDRRERRRRPGRRDALDPGIGITTAGALLGPGRLPRCCCCAGLLRLYGSAVLQLLLLLLRPPLRRLSVPLSWLCFVVGKARSETAAATSGVEMTTGRGTCAMRCSCRVESLTAGPGR